MHYDEALGALVEFAASRHNAFHSSEAAEHTSTQRLRRAELQGHVTRLHPSVWAITSLPATPRQTLRGATLSITDAAATNTSAAWLHGWLGKPPPVPQLWVPTKVSRNHPVADLRRWSRINPKRDITTVSHIPTLNKAATLCSLGSHVDSLTLERCLDEFLRAESVRWLDETMDRLGSRKPGGVAALARIRNDPKRVDGIADSWLERVVAKLVSLPWLPSIELQHPVIAGGRSFRLDIACPELLLGIEAHSRSFHWGRDKEDADNVRDLHLGSAGWKVLYVTHAQTQDPEAFVENFARTAATRAEQLGLPLPKVG